MYLVYICLINWKASRLLERLGNFSITSESYFRTSYESLQNGASAAKENYLKLDTLNVEKERGITVKASAATMLYKPMDGSILSESNTTGYLLLNMVDTPGHVDFGLEVTRSLYAVQGAVLLFDAAQGIQAQSLNVYHKAKVANTVLLPALTKIDLPSAKPLEVSISIADMFKDFDPDLIVHTSARSNIGIDSMLEAVSKEVPAPEIFDDDDGTTFRAQVIDSWFEPLRGVVCLLNIISGTLNEGDRMAVIRSSFYRDKSSSIPKLPKESIFSVQDVGVVLPHRVRTQILSCGQMGYAVIGLRDPRMARPGSMIIAQKDINKIASMRYPSWISLSDDVSRSVLFASVHPMDADEFDELCTAIDKLALNDTGIEVHRTGGASSSDGGPFLGPGLRIGFQGLLHVEVFRQRLSDEYGMDAIVTPPKVPYLIRYLPSKHSRRDPEAPNEEIIEDLSKWPASGERFDVLEPIVKVKVIAPVEYAGNVMELIKRKRGENMVTEPIDDQSWIFSAAMPWGDVVTDFHDSLKNCTAGYASFDTEEAGYKQGDLCRIEIMLNGESVEPLTFVSHRNTAYAEGRAVCSRLKETLPREQFVIKIQVSALPSYS